MINIFKRNKVNINSINIPDFGWARSVENKNIKQWINEEQTIALSLNFFDLKPDLPSIKDIKSLRDFYRNQIIEYNGGIIEVDLVEIKGFKIIKTIFKIPQEPTGMMYLGSLTIPFEKCSYVIKIQAPEVGMTGIRDSVIGNKLLNENVISIGENGYENWFEDPYDSKFIGGTLMNKSESIEFDSEFVDHPLSRVREILSEIQKEIIFNKEFEKINKFKK
ncbi:hypothetical protein [Aureibacter tunicatorum]|uniref:Uncharacterized protein n=1 Tax=Aureibacter tunicatorum TaxID=866807 RepID=A0AAE3XR76_9BACT|nr:hypothetical protein [Aureibacter tunicatorum]MDR6241117.1 hypothetical protein [Aureibacter tunicatorum]BDD03895.1 hypothetical protein AUTU_13780 [Aureibacter tunicatorum]